MRIAVFFISLFFNYKPMLSHFIRLFYPETCASCQALLLHQEFVICTRCRHDLPQTLHHLQKDNEVVRKFYGRIPLVYGGALLYFHKKGAVQELIHHLKYKGQETIGTAIGHWHGAVLQRNFPSLYPDFIIPVPLHPRKQRQRGFNQVDSYADALAERLGIPCLRTLLVRQLYSKTQTKKSIVGRSEVVHEIFGLRNAEGFHHNHFLLVDDVITTGSTLEACARELLKIPGAKISIVCMAMSQ